VHAVEAVADLLAVDVAKLLAVALGLPDERGLLADADGGGRPLEVVDLGLDGLDRNGLLLCAAYWRCLGERRGLGVERGVSGAAWRRGASAAGKRKD
jgi:hypothetical protein